MFYSLLLKLNKTVILDVLLLIIGFAVGYHLSNQKDLVKSLAQQNKALEIQNKQQAAIITKSESAILISNSKVTQATNLLNQQQLKSNTLQKELNNVKNQLNSTNRISDQWLFYIASATSGNSMSNISNSTSNINAATYTYQPDEIAQAITSNYLACVDTNIRFALLQKWIVEQNKNFNR